MPKVRSSRKIKFPKGWDVVEDTLTQLQEQMREGKTNEHKKQMRVCVHSGGCMDRLNGASAAETPRPRAVVHSPCTAAHPFCSSSFRCCSLLSAENQDEAGKRRDELLWPIFRLHHQRSRYIYDMYYNQKKITREVYEFALEEKYADANLIAKWKKVST